MSFPLVDRLFLSWLCVSALCVSASRADSVVVFNEIQYHPANQADPEWIELHNQMAVDIHLRGWKIRGGIDFDFPDGAVISAGGFLLVADTPNLVPGALGPWTGRLSNSGERLQLRNNSNRLMDEIKYEDNGDWPVGADGSGASLAKTAPDTATAFSRNWRASVQTGGTPGAHNFPEETTAGPDLPLIAIDGHWRYEDSGSDPGQNWAASAHPGWPEGQALIGYETTPDQLPHPIMTALSNPAANPTNTYYFETEFTLSASVIASITGLRLRHIIDDGAIFYLNGTEIGNRFHMPSGTVTAATAASPSVGTATYSEPFLLPAGGLIPGQNRFSVEVHQQDPTSSDIIMGVELVAGTEASPASATLLRLSEISGTVEQDFKIELYNGGVSPVDLEGYVLETCGEVDETYIFPPGVVVEAGGYLVLEELETGLHPANDDRVFLYSPERTLLLDATRADDLPKAHSESHGGRMLTPDTATFGGENSFNINSDIVINEIMYHFRDDPGTAPGASIETLLIPMGGTWRYNESGADLGAGWANSSHSAGSDNWLSGDALLGAETSPQLLPLPLLTNIADPRFNAIVTYYLERNFSLSSEQVASITSLKLRHVIDDGAVFYLNGVELERYNISAGVTVTATTTADSVNNANYVESALLPAGALVAGLNRLSVELHQDSPTSSDVVFGAELIALSSIPAQPVVPRDEEWIELHNKGTDPVDLTGWSLESGIRFSFPDGTTIDAGEHLLVSNDAAALAAKYPAAAIIGDFQGALNNATDTIRLRDSDNNPVDEVTYYEGGKWSSLADGDGSSLELRDPDADNAIGGAWAASDESGKSEWQTISYRATGGQSYGLTNWNEFRLGMLAGAEILIDDVSVIRDPDGVAQQLIQNGNFSSGTDKWRMLGNHRHSMAVPEPGNPGNTVLLLDARGPTDTRHNHLETTFVGNTAILASQTYEVSFRARWLSGSNQLNSRAYYQQLARTTQLERPENCGTPGEPNSRLAMSIGPTFSNLSHDPPVPAANQPVTVSADVSDPDGLGTFVLKARVNEGAVQEFGFNVTPDGEGTGTLPGQSAGTVTQFWIEATDALGAVSFAPAGGADSRALVQTDDGQGSQLPVQEIRLIMLDSDRMFMLSTLNLMSNERLGGTTVYNEREIFYDVGLRLRGSGAGRSRDGDSYRGFNIRYNADHLFRGVQSSTSIDRSARSPVVGQQHEIFIKHMFNHAGIPCMYDELVYLVGPTPEYSGTSQMHLAGYGGLFAESQFENGGDGTIFNLDITYDPVTTVDGNPESFKPPTPFTHVGTDLRDLGDSEEDYRTSLEIRTGRRNDDYTGLINFCKKIDLPPAQLAEEIGEWMDVDEWLRYSALTVLCGIGDSFVAGGLRHNIRIYVPKDGRGVTALPWDMDFVFAAGTTSSMLPMTGNLRDVINIPRYKRLYWGHVHDLVNSTFNAGYMTPWLSHYGNIAGQSFGSQAGYITARGNYALSQLPVNVPFAITSSGGGDFSVDDTKAVLEGKGWINVREFRLAGHSEPLAARWLDEDTWQITIPLLPGTNPVTIEAYDFQGILIESDSLVITSTVTDPQPFEFLRITEVHYHPQLSEDHEFVELCNIGTEPLDISGVVFTDGFDFTFPSGTSLAPGAFVLIVSDISAFESVYGSGHTVAGSFSGDGLANSSEIIELRDASGNIIHQFAYQDYWYPATDGGGYSLVVRNKNASVSAWDTADGWAISGQPGGTPGADDSSFSIQFESWQRDYFTEAEIDTASISGPLGDFNHDGINNLLCYAMGINPRDAVPAEFLLQSRQDGDRFHLMFRCVKNTVDLSVHAEFTSDLVEWVPVFSSLPEATDHGDGTKTLIFEDPQLQGAGRMGRVFVTLNSP